MTTITQSQVIPKPTELVASQLQELSTQLPIEIEAPSSKLLLGFLLDSRLRVRQPIVVHFETEGQQTIAEAIEFNEFGFGANSSEALTDLQHAISELYWALDAERLRLGPDLAAVLNDLARHLERLG